MEVIKIKKHSEFLKNNLPFIVLALIVFFTHFTFDIIGDDEISKAIKSISRYNEELYKGWSSRLVIITLNVIMCKTNMWVWRICDTLIFVFLAYILSYFLIDKNKKTGNWIICGLFLLYPFWEMSSAGWICTTIDYLWVLFFGFLTIVPLKKYYLSIRLKWYEYIIYILAMIFASNQEQMAIIIITIYLLFFIYFFHFKNSKIFIIILLMVAFGNLLFTLTCPGNFIRLNNEISTWMNEFLMFSKVDKFTSGFMTTSLKYIGTKENTLLIIELLLCIKMFQKYTNVLFRTISSIPLAVKFLFGFLIDNSYFEWLKDPNNIYKYRIYKSTVLPESANFPFLANEFKPAVFPGLTEGVYDVITPANYLQFNVYLSVFLSVMVIGCILISLFILINNYKHFIFLSVILGATFLSRIVMGFSPTLYASGGRTFIFFHFSLVALCIYIVDTFFLKKEYPKNITEEIEKK